MRLLILFVGVLMTMAASADAPLVRANAWTLESATLARDLTQAPGECYARDAATPRTEIGRALFRSPALLGGPAARIGLSCDSCHANGRANARFFLPELTDRPGASDVTSEWSSRTRGDGFMNPRVIPDLVGVSGRGTFGQGHVLSLEGFTGSVVMDEFQGAAPPAQAFDGLIAYMRALDADACPEGAHTPITLASQSEDVRRALAAAAAAEPETARLVLLAAQDALGRIDERLPAAQFAAEKRTLAGLGRELGAARRNARLASDWSARFDALVARLAAREPETYFNETALAAALNGAR